MCRLLQVTIPRPRGQASPRRSQWFRERLGLRQLRHNRCWGPVTSRGPGIEQRLLLLRFGRPGGGCTLHDRQPIGAQVAGGTPTHGTGTGPLGQTVCAVRPACDRSHEDAAVNASFRGTYQLQRNSRQVSAFAPPLTPTPRHGRPCCSDCRCEQAAAPCSSAAACWPRQPRRRCVRHASRRRRQTVRLAASTVVAPPPTCLGR